LEVLNILQNHYPERLGLALILNVPWLVNMFFKLIQPFIDPVTRNKMKFNPKVNFRCDINFLWGQRLTHTLKKVVKDGIFTPDMVLSDWTDEGRKFEYIHEKYWPALVEMCNERRKQQMEGWRQLGGDVGLKEWDVRIALSTSENEITAVEEKHTVSA
jgi:hypothetical protein